jgi:hypothetical protein
MLISKWKKMQDAKAAQARQDKEFEQKQALQKSGGGGNLQAVK